MKELFAIAVTALEAAAVIVLLAGVLMAAGRYAVGRLQKGAAPQAAYGILRQGIGRTLLLALELLVAADIVYTVVVEPTLDHLGGLGLLVLIRTFLSFSLEVELEGRWPWQSKRKPPEEA